MRYRSTVRISRERSSEPPSQLDSTRRRSRSARTKQSWRWVRSQDTSVFGRRPLSILARVPMHDGPVLALSIGPDDGTLVSVGSDGAKITGRYVPSTPEAAARLTRLAAAGAEVLPIDAAHEMSLVNAFPNVDWPAASDPVAAAFWKLVQENGLQPTQPANWWQWLWWSSPFELSPGLAQCKNRIRGLRSQMSWTSWRNTIEQPRRSNNSRYVRMRCLRSTSDRADA